MRREFPDDMTEHGHEGREMGNGGNVLALRKRESDVEEQRISPVEMVSRRRDLFGPVYEPTITRRKRDRETTNEDPDAVTFLSTTERTQVQLLERIAILMEADDHLDANVVTIGSLGDMQNTHCVESPGDQEDVVRGAWEREFRLPPRIELMGMMSLIGLIVGPISGFHTDIDVVVGTFRVLVKLVVMLSRGVLKKKPRQQDCPTAHCGRVYPDRVARAEAPYPTVTEEVATREPQKQ
jgi:hypothetical protein